MTFWAVFRSLKYQCTDSIQNKQKPKKRADKKRAFHPFDVRSHTKSTRDFALQNSIHCPPYCIHPNTGALYSVFIRVHCSGCFPLTHFLYPGTRAEKGLLTKRLNSLTKNLLSKRPVLFISLQICFCVFFYPTDRLVTR